MATQILGPSGTNVEPMPATDLSDLWASSRNAVATQKEMFQIQHYQNSITSKLKTKSAISKSMTGFIEECARKI